MLPPLPRTPRRRTTGLSSTLESKRPSAPGTITSRHGARDVPAARLSLRVPPRVRTRPPPARRCTYTQTRSRPLPSPPFQVPFQKSINVTYRAGPGQPNDSVYMIVRGVEGVPVSVDGWTLSAAQMATARLQLQVVTGTYAPLAYVTVADVPTGAGFILLHTLSFAAGNLNTLEGCYRVMTPYSAPYPGQLLSSGTE